MHMGFIYTKTLNTQILTNYLNNLLVCIFKGKVRMIGNAKRQRFLGKIDIRSPILTIKMQSNIAIRGGKTLNVRTQVDYVIPKVIRDKITLTAKVSRAQTKTTTSIKGNT